IAAKDGELGLSRLLTLFGTPLRTDEIVERYGLRVGTTLPRVKPLALETITTLNNEICKYETFWAKRLSSLQPVSLPYVQTGNLPHQAADTSELKVSIPAELLSSVRALWPDGRLADVLASAFSLYLARLCGEARFDLGLR